MNILQNYRIVCTITIALVLLSLHLHNQTAAEDSTNNNGSLSNNRNEDVNLKNAQKCMYTILMDCFNIRQNLKTTFNTDVSPQSIPVINGIKYDLLSSNQC